MKLILVDFFYSAHFNRFTRKEIDFINHYAKKHMVVFYMLGERWNNDTYVNSTLQLFCNDETENKIIFVLDRLSTVDDVNRFLFNKKLRYDSQLIKVAQYQENTEFNIEINLDTNRFLFLMGKPYKVNRLPFLYELYRNNLLQYCDYSFYNEPRFADKNRNILAYLTDGEFEQFVSTAVKKLDDIKLGGEGLDFFDYFGLPVDHNLYKNTSFSVIAESLVDSNNYHFISEKTWRTIANKHMFVSMASKGYKDFLNSLNIRTFDYCLKYDKNSFDCNDYHLLNQLTVENVVYLLKNIDRYKDRIKEDVEHNFSVYRALVENERSRIDPLIEKELHLTDLIPGYRHIKVLHLTEPLNQAVTKLTNVFK